MINWLACKVHGGRYIPSATSDDGVCGGCIPKISQYSATQGDFKAKSVPSVGAEEKQPLNPSSWGKFSYAGSYCLCSECNEIFNSLWGFDMHRVGITERWCLDEAEMRKKGMSINAKGVWITQEYSRLHS